MQNLKSLLTGNITCVVSQNDQLYTETNSGIIPLLNFIEKGVLKDALVADKVIGKAAAMLLVYGGITELYAQVISEFALTYLNSHDIPITYETKVPYIINRKKDGMCPMEKSVLSIDDEILAYEHLKEKVNKL
ncbi:MAG: DUF1893 domain-containing protein [Longicatena sp.]